MNVDELMNLDRPLTDEEMAFMEQEVLKLARQLKTEVANITSDLDPSDPVVARLREGPTSVERSIEAAIECRSESIISERQRKRSEAGRSSSEGGAAGLSAHWAPRDVHGDGYSRGAVEGNAERPE